MSKIRESNKNPTEKKNRLLEAKESFQKMQKEIAPFIKRRKFTRYSSSGKWCETSSLYS